MQLPPDVIERLLDTWPVARLATRGPGEAPHQVPVVFARAEGSLWSPVDGKPKGGGELARVRNVERSPAVSLLLDDYTPDWTRLWWLRVEGEARVVRAAPEADAEVAAAVRALSAKYPQYQALPVLRDPPTLIAIAPRRTSSWAAGAQAVAAATAASS